MQPVLETDGLAELPPGPRLAAALASLDLATVPNDRMLDVLVAQNRQLSHDQARMAAVLAELGRCAGHPDPGAAVRLDGPERYAPEECRAALRWTRRAAEWEHELAETVVHWMPAVHAAWLAGHLDRARVLVFHRYLVDCAPEQVTAICRAAVPRAPGLTPGQLAVLLRHMVLAIDPEAAARWYRNGIRERDVIAIMNPDGTVSLSGHGLPADEAEAACIRVQDLAAAAKRAGHPGLIGPKSRCASRCDLFLGLLDGRFDGMTSEQLITTLIAQYRPDGPGAAHRTDTTGPAGPGGTEPRAPSGRGPTGREPTSETGPERFSGAQAGIEIRAALSALLGRDEHPGEIPGLGLLPAPDTRARVALQRRAEWRFAVTDPDGRLLSEGVTRRRPAMVGDHPVDRDGPPGGIVEIHIPIALLYQLVAEGAGDWSGVVADVAAQHARRHDHLADLDAHPEDRFPKPALRRHAEIRDRTCTFPGCRHRAHTADQDHTADKARGGPTVTANVGPLCGHDHDVKHRGGWRLEQPEPGTFAWRSPLGGEYRTRGEWLLPELPDPVPVDLGEHFDQPTRSVDGPILQPYRPVERPRPPPARILPDDPPF